MRIDAREADKILANNARNVRENAPKSVLYDDLLYLLTWMAIPVDSITVMLKYSCMI